MSGSRLILKEMTGDLFTAPQYYSLAHCVAADMKMGKGIAILFKNKFGSIQALTNQNVQKGGVAIIQDNNRFIYYLVTKDKSHQKPTYEHLFSSLVAMREHMRQNNISKLAIPRIGCGLDRLVWNKVQDQLYEIFGDDNVEIIVYNFQ